jgi:hypothetical protein
MLTNLQIHRMARPKLHDFQTEAQILDSVTCANDSSLDGLTFAWGELGKGFNGTNQYPIGTRLRSCSGVFCQVALSSSPDEPNGCFASIPATSTNARSNPDANVGGRRMAITREECLELQRKCWEDCWKRGAPLGHNNRKTYEHWRYCDQLCTEQYLDCLRAAHTSGLVENTVKWAFGGIAKAVDWVVNHPTEAKKGRTTGRVPCMLF